MDLAPTSFADRTAPPRPPAGQPAAAPTAAVPTGRRLALTSGLVQLMQQRSDLRGAYALADQLELAVTWGV